MTIEDPTWYDTSPQPTPPGKKKRMAVAAGLTAGLLGGGAIGLAFTGNPLGAGAQASQTTAPSTTAPATAPPGAGNGTATNRPDPTTRLKEILKPLVDKGTINQSQADAVIDALEAAGPLGGPGGHGGPGHGGPGRGGRGGPNLDVAAKALGITTTELQTQLRAGTSIKDIAATRKVDVQTVIDALVGDLKTKLATEVKNGTITQAQADERLTQATDRITRMVNGERPAGHDGPPPGDAPGTPPADGGSSTTTTPGG